MIITRIEPVTKAKSRVYAEEEPLFVLYNRELSQYRIREGGELSVETYREILTEVLGKRAKRRLLYLLKSMDRTEWQLRQKLAGDGYPQSVIDEAIAYVQSFHYLDDQRYAGNYVEVKKSAKSRRQIEQELYRKGIVGETARQALESCSSEQEQEAIRGWMRKRHFVPEEATREEQQKMYAFLLRRGFRMSDVLRAVRLEEGEQEQQDGSS